MYLNGKSMEKSQENIVQDRYTETQVVPWEKAVWNVGGIPRHSFLTWLFVLDLCPTRDRVFGWGLQKDLNCLLCNSGIESRDHLLFDCPFSWSIWSHMARRCNLQPARSWMNSINQMQTLSGGKLLKRLTLIAWQASIYWIWLERNERLHRQIFLATDSITTQIDRQIRNRIASFRDGNPGLASKLLQLWLSTRR